MPPRRTEIVHIASEPVFRKGNQKSLTNSKNDEKEEWANDIEGTLWKRSLNNIFAYNLYLLYKDNNIFIIICI